MHVCAYFIGEVSCHRNEARSRQYKPRMIVLLVDHWRGRYLNGRLVGSPSAFTFFSWKLVNMHGHDVSYTLSNIAVCAHCFNNVAFGICSFGSGYLLV